MPYDKKTGEWRSMNDICDEAYQQAVEMGEVPPENSPSLRPVPFDVAEEQADWESDENDRCQPIGCDNGHHLPGCKYALLDTNLGISDRWYPRD